MQFFCGTDIIEVDRVKKALLSTPNFKEAIFSSKEIEYAESKSDITKFQHYAGRFAAKEAIYKSLSSIDNGLSLCNIEIINDKSNKNRPVVNIYNNANLISLINSGNLKIDVSISHIKDYATAHAVATIF